MSVDVQVEVVIDRPVVEVGSFAGDPSNAPQWYANIVSVSWQTTPPVSTGARMDFGAHFLGRTLTYTYEVVELVQKYGARDPERVNRRNGYRHRELDTRVGALDVAVPKLREGSLFPEWLMQRRRRAEAALTTVVATCYCSESPPGGWTSCCAPWPSPA